MLRKKYYNLSFVITIVMFFNWVLTVFLPYNDITLLPYDNLKSEKKNFIISLLLNSGSYESLLNLIFLILVYLLSLNYLLTTFDSYYIIRFKSKLHFFKYNFIHCAFLSLLFIFIKTFIGIICSTLLFGYSDLADISFYKVCLLNFFLPVLFYLSNGLILTILNYIIGKKYSVVLLFLFNLLEYALLKFHIVDWIFIKDATKFSMFISGKITSTLFISSLFRDILYVLLISFIGINIIRKLQ